MTVETNAVIISDSFAVYPPEAFCIPSFYVEDIDSVLIPEGLIRDRIKGLAREIFHFYASPASNPEPLTLVCVLKSAFKFFCALQQELENLNVEDRLHLSRQSSSKSVGNEIPQNGMSGENNGDANARRTLPLMCEFIRVKSYVNTSSSQENDVQIQGLINPGETFAQKNVLIVEDIIDSGKTMHALLKSLTQYNLKSVRVASMLWKRVLRQGDLSSFKPHFYGFEIPDKFVIGFGMDYNEKFRDLNHLCIISQRGIDKHAV